MEKSEYKYQISDKVGNDLIFLARGDTWQECINDLGVMKQELLKLAELESPSRNAKSYLPPEDTLLENCQFPVEHGIKFAKKGSKGMYCVECWKKKKQSEGTWKAK